jgi:hypothetical protein
MTFLRKLLLLPQFSALRVRTGVLTGVCHGIL